MRKVINISIPEPCHEDWNTMTTKEKGRHCDVCSKTVIDFTKSTDEQLVETLENQGNLCGRFKNTQLNREIVLSRKDKNNYVSIAASGLFAFLSLANTQKIRAQGAPNVVHVDATSQHQILGKVATSILNERVISGTVFGEDNYRIPNAIVTIKGTEKSVKTDFGGDFLIKVKNGDVLVIESPFYKTVELDSLQSNKYQIVLIPIAQEVISITGNIAATSCETETQTIMLGGVVGGIQIVSYGSKVRRKLVREGIIDRSSFGKFLYTISNPFRSKK